MIIMELMMEKILKKLKNAMDKNDEDKNDVLKALVIHFEQFI